jgi:hypothetical protein
MQAPAAYGAALQGPDFEFAGHGPVPGMVLARCPALARLASARDAAAAARGSAAAAALAGAAAGLAAARGALAALVRGVSEIDVLAGFAAISEASPPGVAWCRPAFAAAAAERGDGGGGGGACRTPPLHLKGLW